MKLFSGILVLFCVCIFPLKCMSDEISSAYEPDREVVAELLKRHSYYTENDVLAHYAGCNDAVYKWQVLCVNYNYLKADLSLNKIYKNLIVKNKGTRAEKKLILAQRSWLSFRDLSCDFENDSYDESKVSYLTRLSCEAIYADERVKKLNEYFGCYSAGCPGEK